MTGANYWLEFADLLPKSWSKIGHPVPVPGGFIFASRNGYHRVVFISRYDTTTRALAPVLDDQCQVLSYRTSNAAREALPGIAHEIESEDD